MNSFIHLWGKPILLAIITIAGLIIALVKKGMWQYVAWLLLIIPILVMGQYLYIAYKKSMEK